MAGFTMTQWLFILAFGTLTNAAHTMPCISTHDFRQNFSRVMVRNPLYSPRSPRDTIQYYLYHGEPAVRKVLHLSRVPRQRALREIATMQLLQAVPSVVRYHTCVDHGSRISIFMEGLGGNLHDERAYFHTLPWPQKLSLLLDVTLGFLHIHKLGYVHGDIKAPNVAFTVGRDRLKIIDFGLTVPTLYPLDGYSPFYVPPERILLQDSRALPSKDVWSWGVTVLEALMPHLAARLSYAYGNVEVSVIVPEMLPEVRQHLRDESDANSLPLHAVMRGWLRAQPENRPSMADIARGLRALLYFLQTGVLIGYTD